MRGMAEQILEGGSLAALDSARDERAIRGACRFADGPRIAERDRGMLIVLTARP